MDQTVPTTATAPAAVPRRRRRPRQGYLWLFIAPALIPYLLFVLLPAGQGVWFSFTDWNLLDPIAQFVGFENYARLIEDPEALRALGNTLFLVVTTVVLENVIGLLLALGIRSKIKSRAVLRLIYFSPVIIVTVVIGFLWRFMLLPDGPVNELLGFVGLESLQHPWLGDPATALWMIAFMTVWQFSGYTMVIFLANLEEIPAELREAAALDGAGAVQTFRAVVLPMLGPSLTINVILSTIRGLMLFDIIWVTTQGGPADSTNSLATLVYRNAFQYSEFGYSLAIAVTLSIFVALVAIAQYRLLNRKKDGIR